MGDWTGLPEYSIKTDLGMVNYLHLTGRSKDYNLDFYYTYLYLSILNYSTSFLLYISAAFTV